MQGRISEDILNLIYDFTRCVRADGSVYGTGGKCRKGTEEAKQVESETGRHKKRPSPLEASSLIAEKTTEEKKKRGPKPGGIRITAKMRALSPEDLRKVINDPRANDRQKAALQKLLAEKESGKAGDKAPRKEEKMEVNKEATPQTPKTPKVSIEKIKKAFDKVSAEAVKADITVSKMYREGVEYDDPQRKAAEKKKASLVEKVNTLRMAYHAIDKEEFLRSSAKLATLKAKVFKLSEIRSDLMKKDGLTYLSKIPKDHPSQKVNKVIKELEEKARVEMEKREAAYFGEPLNISKAKSDGGGQVSSFVPSSLPKGGGSKELKEFLDGAEIVMAFQPKGFASFVKQGEAKNGFEEGTQGIKKGRARAYLEGRRRGEEEILGLPQETPPKGRPVYAALEHPDRSRSLQGGDKLMSQYGGIQVVMKPAVKDRSSFTFGDSLDDSRGEGVMASPVRDPANPARSFRGEGKVKVEMGGGASSMRIRIGQRLRDKEMTNIPYMEAQIHGGLKLSDVKEVRYYRGQEMSAAARKTLEKAGIRVTELPPRMQDVKTSRVADPNFANIDAVGVFE